VKVSVIVPVFNKAPYIERCLASILAQHRRPDEVIVVNDGSTDGSGIVAERFSSDLVTVISQENRGPGAARNVGLRRASGDLVAFLDGDDEWLPDFLTNSLCTFERLPLTACVTLSYIDEPGASDSTSLWLRRGFRSGRQDPRRMDTAGFLHAVAFMSPCTTVCRTSVLRGYGGFYEGNSCRYAEDAYLWLQILLKENVYFDLVPGARIHRSASELSAATRIKRPLEPFLENPDTIRDTCPVELLPLLERFFAVRAYKTACAWAYWGDWQAARRLREKFDLPGARRLPYYFLSAIACTPAGALAGLVHRAVTKAF